MAKKNKQSQEAKKESYKFKLPLRQILVVTLSLTAVLASLIMAFLVFFKNRIYPGISIAAVEVSTLTQAQAEDKLNQALADRLNQTLEFNYPNSTESALSSQSYKIQLSDKDIEPNIDLTLTQALEYGHKKLYFKPVILALKPSLNDSINEQIKALALSMDQPPISSQLKVEEDQINVTPSQDGFILDQARLKQELLDYINTGSLSNKTLPIKKIAPKLTYESALQIKKRLDQIKLSPLKLKFEEFEYDLDLATILNLIDLENTGSHLVSIINPGEDSAIEIKSASLGSDEFLDTKLALNQIKLSTFLKNIKGQIDRGVEEPLFNFDPQAASGKARVTEFKPGREGRRLDLGKTSERISQALINQNQTAVNLAVDTTKPKNKLTNDLGIKELIGRGISNFAGSIPNRIYNIGLTASRINGVLIPPGETFSFVSTVGDISAATGFKQAYVIKSGRTVLDDGGGVCQDSTTLFRAVLNAGLPIVARTAHAYRVGYYEQGFPPGLDATVFYPTVDFKFKNDTPAHILIQAYVEGVTLYMDLYGSSDGRQVNLTTPIVLNQTPPPPELRQDDPTLPKGTVKQVDFAAWGANVSFKRTVTKAGQVLINETYYSNYRPWQAVYLVGTQ